jgi:D-arabinose 1-dehydrogenase-like Zn-dependent alcohol dehydrogenase
LDHAVNAAQLQVPIAAVHTIEEAAQAHARIEKGQILGRIVLQIRSDRQLRIVR